MTRSISKSDRENQALLDELRKKVVVVRLKNGERVIVPVSRIAENPDGTVRILPRQQDGEG